MQKNIFKYLVFFLTIIYAYSDTSPTENVLVVTTDTANARNQNFIKESSFAKPLSVKINEMHVRTRVRNRYAVTTIQSKVKNYDNRPRQTSFSVILPDSAFVSNFTMEINGKNYTAYVQEKEEAKKVYEDAVAQGTSAAHVATARDSNRFTVSVNVEGETKAAFYLIYEELLNRQNGHYQLIINLHPGELVNNLDVFVEIAESRRLTDVKIPPLRSGNEIQNDKNELDSRAFLQIVNDTKAIIKFAPNVERQKALAFELGAKEEDGLAGQFVVEYDVERDPVGGEILIQEGYFVHFFAPKDMKSLLKYVVFVLDTSSSMWGQMIQQLKEAMREVLNQLHPEDLFHLVEFNTNVRVWNLNNYTKSVWFPTADDVYWNELNNPFENITNQTFPEAYTVNDDNIKKAVGAITKFEAVSATDIHTALQVGLHLIKTTKQNTKYVKYQPIIMFLTDGEPTVRETSTEKILNDITRLNEQKTPIFTLSFGEGADKHFLKRLSLNNYGFAKHIYEGADAALQLQNFYQQISSPLLSNVSFKYVPTTISVTKTDFPIYFDGSEMVVAGRYDTNESVDDTFGNVIAWNGHDVISMNSTVEKSITSLERLWAYLSLKHLLNQKEVENESRTEFQKKALHLALKYSFVTPISSLVVVKPNSSSNVDVDNAKGEDFSSLTSNRFGGVPLSANLYSDFEYDESIDSPDFSNTTALETSDSLIVLFPWINTILDENGYITIPKGKYKLGLNETTIRTNVSNCTIKNISGRCVLLNSCIEARVTILTLEDYINYFCELTNQYAGICCLPH